MKKIKNIIIVCNGEDYSRYKIITYSKNADYIICADGALNLLDEIGIVPDIIIGDMDSVNKALFDKYKDVKMEKHSADKDLTDSELALIKAVSLSPENIFIFSTTGSYIDHSLANLINIIKYQKDNINIELLTSNSKMFIINDKKEFLNLVGRRISIFPVGEVKEIDITGFKYNYKNNKNLTSVNYSVSNVIISLEASVKVTGGMVFCILFDEGFE